jgi:hypothetical protein
MPGESSPLKTISSIRYCNLHNKFLSADGDRLPTLLRATPQCSNLRKVPYKGMSSASAYLNDKSLENRTPLVNTQGAEL